MPKRNHKSSRLKFVSLALLIVVSLGAVVAVVSLQPDGTFNNQVQQPETLDQSTATKSPDIPISQDNMLSIPAWNVKFSIPSTIQNTKVMYVERKSNDEPPVTYYAFTTSRIKELGSKCQTQPFGDTVLMYRFSEKPIAVPDGMLVNEEPIDGYYYTVTSPIAPCSGFDESGNMRSSSQVEKSDRDALKEMGRSIQAN